MSYMIEREAVKKPPEIEAFWDLFRQVTEHFERRVNDLEKRLNEADIKIEKLGGYKE